MESVRGSKSLIKIVLYCHNLSGLGHIIRSARIAERLSETGVFLPVLLTGCRVLDFINLPQGIRIEKMTPIPKDEYDTDRYSILSTRAKHIYNYIEDFSPEIVLVDTLPLGYGKELKPSLQANIEKSSPTTFVLGLPYLQDDGFEPILKNPFDSSALSAYRFAMQYSDDNWGDEVAGLPFKIEKVGSIAGPEPPVLNPFSKTILVFGGGGTVSLPLLDPVIKATSRFRDQGYIVKFVMGPLADFSNMKAIASGCLNFHLVEMSSIEDALKDARIVISRCGYNTTLTLMRTPVPVVFIPYYMEEGKGEQSLRAKGLMDMDNVQVLDLSDDHIEIKLETAIHVALNSELKQRACPFSLNGLDLTVDYLLKIATQLRREQSSTEQYNS